MYKFKEYFFILISSLNKKTKDVNLVEVSGLTLSTCYYIRRNKKSITLIFKTFSCTNISKKKKIAHYS